MIYRGRPKRQLLEGQIIAAAPEEAAVATDETMQASRESMKRGFEAMKAEAARYMAEIAQIMSVSPVITPRLAGASLRGIHADVGVD